MYHSGVTRGRGPRVKHFLLAISSGLLAIIVPAARSIDGEVDPVLRVEEDWVMVLNEPDDQVDSPQFHTVMSPFNHLDYNYAQVLWNYRELTRFTPGGVQLHSYYGESVTQKRSMEYGQLSTTAETISWSQALSTDGAMLSFEVFNGSGATWGTFGRDMRIDANANLADLNQYSPDVSAENACVTFGANRVESLIIHQVRYYHASGLVSVDTTPRVAFQYGDLQQ